MIELQQVSKTYNRNTANEVKALRGISLTIMPGEFVVIVGSNGSGKSSLLNAVAGSIHVDAGKISIDGNEITHLKEYQRSRWIARIFQNPLMGTAPELTILENFRLASLRTRPKKLFIGTNEKFSKKIQEKISLLNLGLENKTDQLMGTLSGGQRQALTLLMAVIPTQLNERPQYDTSQKQTNLLLMDEPAAALDPKTSDLLMNLAGKMIREFHLTTLFITHQLKDALAYGDRLILMQEGKIIKDLHKAEKSKLDLNTLYNWFGG